MKKNLLLGFVVIFLLNINNVFSQKLINVNPDPNGEPWIAGGLKPLTPAAKKKLLATKQLTFAISKSLPAKVDNSSNMAFRPIFTQVGGCCAQASGVGYNYTYEMNLLWGTAANSDNTLFPSHFTWNFLNYGTGQGSWYWDGWDIIKENGIPTVSDFGSFDADGDETFWMSGYDKYLNGMKNRLVDYKTIDASTYTGINNMKQWIYDHGRGDAVGGLINFSALASNYDENTLPDGTEEAGKMVITAWGNDGAHAMTIVGYNDNICFDYNGDGQYTTSVDINNDGVVDLKDCERGAFIAANSWGESFGNNGFYYLMYRVCAFSSENGGLLNNQLVHVINSVEQRNTPDLTLKIRMSHSDRSALQYKYGYNPDVNATTPSTEVTFNSYSQAGGKWPMGGKSTSETDEFSFGIDISSLKSQIVNNTGKFFFNIYSSGGEGKMLTASLMDYSRTNPEFIAQQSNVDINKGNTLITFILQPADKPMVSMSNLSNETEDNTGNLEPIDINLTNINFSKSSGNLTEGVDYNVSNLPQGLSVQVNVKSQTSAVLSFIGSAVEHDNINDEPNFKISFNASSFNISDVSNVVNDTSNIFLNFDDPYKVVFVNLNDITIDASHTWTYFSLNYGNSDYGGWFENGNLRIESYTKELVCSGNERNIAVLPFNTEIGTNSNWIAGGNYPNEHILCSSSYTDWNGKTAYFGFKIVKSDNSYFGWIKATVSSDGKSMVLHNAAYYTKPNASIRAGSGPQPTLMADKSKISEDEVANNGIVTDVMNFNFLGGTFNISSDSTLVQNQNFTISGLPNGLTAEGKVIDSNKLVLSFKGVAIDNSASNSVHGIKLSFNDNVFNNNNATDVLGSTVYLDFTFFDPYSIRHFNIDPVTVNSTDTWKSFLLDDDNTWFGGWMDNGNLRIETYGKQALCENSDSRLMTPIDKDVTIGKDSKFWIKAGNYPDEHYLYKTDYTKWAGKDGYVGIAIPTESGKQKYGWLHVVVNQDGTEMTIDEAAYHEGPYHSIKTGSVELINTPSLSATGSFVEPYANDGSLTGVDTISIVNDMFTFNVGQTLVKDVDYTISGLPQGLTPVIKVVDALNISVELTGNAVNNTISDDTDFFITFNDAAFKTSPAANVENNPVSMHINFKGPFKVIYTDIDDITVNVDNTWKYFSMGMGTDGFGAYWYGLDNKVKIETYTHPIVGYANTINIKALNYGDVIGSATNDWITGGTYPNEPNLSTSDYTEWNGKEAYVGVALDNGPYLHYGWMRIEVAADGSSYTIKDFAYYDAPNMPILAGYKQPVAIKPITMFNSDNVEVFENEQVHFTDNSANGVDTWKWEFQGGSPATSVLQNPVVTYPNNGTYNVTLITTNSAGSDTLVMKNYITVNEAIAPIAAFISDNTTIYESAQVMYYDKSLNSPDSYHWTFEGGSPATSTEVNPIITYANSGTYSVTLKVINQFGENTLTKNGYVTVKANDKPSYCDGSNQEYQYETLGISNITLSNINNDSQRDSIGYSDFSEMIANMNIGQTYAFSFQLSPNWSGDAFQAWIDWNRDGQWTENEVVFQMNGTSVYQGEITVPDSAVVGLTGMRVRTSYYDYEDGPCAVGTYQGEVEDYTVNIASLVESLDFAVNKISAETGEDLMFRAISNDTITSSQWTCTNGTNSITFSGNTVSKSFQDTGSYKVSLSSVINGNTILVSKESVFTITQAGVNHAPTDVLISADSVMENAAVGTIIGELSAVDPDQGDTFTFTLAQGGADNDKVLIDGTQLKLNATLNYSTQQELSINVEVTDQGGLSTSKQLTIAVIEQIVNHAPTDVLISADSVMENATIGTVIGELSALDPDQGDTFTFALAQGGADNDKVLIDGTQLKLNATLNYSTQQELSINVEVTDQGGLSISRLIYLYVINVTAIRNVSDNIINIYPNPIGDVLNISSLGIKKIVICNIMGEILIVKNVKYENNVSINVNNLLDGIYFIQVETSNGIFIKKVIK